MAHYEGKASVRWELSVPDLMPGGRHKNEQDYFLLEVVVDYVLPGPSERPSSSRSSVASAHHGRHQAALRSLANSPAFEVGTRRTGLEPSAVLRM